MLSIIDTLVVYQQREHTMMIQVYNRVWTSVGLGRVSSTS